MMKNNFYILYNNLYYSINDYANILLLYNIDYTNMDNILKNFTEYKSNYMISINSNNNTGYRQNIEKIFNYIFTKINSYWSIEVIYNNVHDVTINFYFQDKKDLINLKIMI